MDFYLIDIMIINGSIKHSVEVIQEVNDLHGCAHCWYGGKTYNIAEVDGHFFKSLGLDGFTSQQTVRNGPTEMWMN